MPVRRLRQSAALVRPLVRSVRWLPLLAAGAAGLIIAFLLTKDATIYEGGQPAVGHDARIQALRIAAVLLAMAAAFLPDDPAEDTTAHLPLPRWLRRLVRIILAVPVFAFLWTVTVWVALRTNVVPDPFPIGAVSLEMAALVLVAMALSAGTAPLVPERLGGVAGGPILLGLVVGSLFLPGHLGLFPTAPWSGRWHGAHQAWWGVLVSAVVALAWWSRDPWRQGRRLAWAVAGRASRGPSNHGDQRVDRPEAAVSMSGGAET